jgi:hypothetical protein
MKYGLDLNMKIILSDRINQLNFKNKKNNS